MINLDEYLRQLEDEADKEELLSLEYQKQLFENYVMRNEQHREYRETLLREYQSGAELTGPDGLRKKLGAIDLGYFGRAYLPHYFVRESPQFHEELDSIWTQGSHEGPEPFAGWEEDIKGERLPPCYSRLTWACEVDKLHL
ncbi:hypothetical protein WJ0W_006893 [Paenibacillus melissococcoides]|uniref:Uncharacterized protein n=1 Tax=Paenibacillus melissococcoides TaxID=2912268 RepID=A0ABM9GD72_9BACL|nr:hypothetical protein [Paenibacillus melissococcoides]CAH8249709.1 hypothetical protein WJ0W_006893 [Paenibacillus melissococcoides]